MVVILTILPNVMSPTKALGGIRLSDICSDSQSKYIQNFQYMYLHVRSWTYLTHCDINVQYILSSIFFLFLCIAFCRIGTYMDHLVSRFQKKLLMNKFRPVITHAVRPGFRFRLSFFFLRSVINCHLVSRVHASLVHAYDTWKLQKLSW